MPSLTPGTRLHDRYLLEQRIGSGGMAQVWRARDLVLGREVAVKTLIGHAAADPQLRAGVRQEAQAAARLTHPHITAVHDYAEVIDIEGTVTPYLVMELLRGETLADRLARGPLPWPQAAAIGAQVASALAAAHAQGVVHQDVKPANIMLTPSGVKVLDFGIAAVTGHQEPSGWVVGTPGYAPPEKLRQAPPAPAGDVYSLGVLLCEMVLGHRPWHIQDWEQALQHHARPFVPPQLPPSVPPHAADAIREALDPTPSRRPTTTAFAQLLGGGPARTLVAPVGGPVAAAASVPHRPQETVIAPMRAARRGRSPALVAGAALAGLIVLIGAVFLFSSLLRPGGEAATASPSAPATPSSAPPPATPSPTLSVSGVPALLDQLGEAIETAAATGELRRNEAKDLRNRLRDIREKWADGKVKEFLDKVQDMRKQLRDREDEEDISEATVQQLDSILVRLTQEAGSGR